ncbi:MAG: 5'/3'-nucleotidase SurE [Dehalococcoidia bacterium]|nr:5'/3'-nucleotidase SurE [Dehalococcoidia bacterium]
MRILVTNDDGIYARGLWTLVGALKEVSEVVVVAPDREQSAVGSSVTLHQPLRAREITPPVKGVKSYCVEGTPADCVILALRNLNDSEIDLVLSGINEGANLGDDVLISGTVGAALQGHLNGIPSVALSVASLEDVHFDAAARLAVVLVRKIGAEALPKDIFLNVNLPNLPLDQIRGMEITQLGRRSYSDEIKEGHDGKRKYYWIVRGKPEWQPKEGTDIWALLKDKISITPLHSDLTSQQALSPLKELSPTILHDLFIP